MRKVTEIERCALTLLQKATTHYGPLDWVRDAFLADSGTEKEARWDVLSLYGLNPRDDDEPISRNHWYAEYMEQKRRGWRDYNEHRNIHEGYRLLLTECQEDEGAYSRWLRDQDQATVNLLFAIMQHREAEKRGEQGDRFERLDLSGMGIITSLAANVVEYHQAILDAYALFVDRRYGE